MKIARKLLFAAVLFGGGMAIGSLAITSNADGLVDPNQPGSVNDPLVTKGYVDQQVKALVEAELSKQSGGNATEITKQLEEFKKQLEASASRDLVVVTLQAGETLYAGAGTEFIVRTTNGARAISSTPDGIPDLTDGKNIEKGAMIPRDHLLLFPREDGRGIQAVEGQTVYVMVRGKYMHIGTDGTPVQPAQ